MLVDGRLRRRAAQAADAGVAQRLLLRARSHQRQEPADDAVRRGELGEGDRRGRASDSRSRRRSRRATACWSRPTRAAPPTIARRASIRRPGSLIVSAQDAYGIYFFKPEHGAYGWAGADYSVYGRARAARDRLSDRRRSAGATTSATARRRAGVLTTAIGADVHRRHRRQRARAPHQRRHDAVARRHRPRRQLADHLRARRPSVRADRRRQRALRLDTPMRNLALFVFGDCTSVSLRRALRRRPRPSAGATAAGTPRVHGSGDGASHRRQQRRASARLAADRAVSRSQSHGDRRRRRLHGRLDHRRLAAAALRRVLSRQALRRPRHQRPDDAADADPDAAGRHRAPPEGRGDPRRHQRHRRQHRSDDRRTD